MAETVKLLDVVALTVDLPEDNLWRGQIGTVVEVLKNGTAFEVEFSDRSGRTYESLGLRADQIMVLYYEPIAASAQPVVTLALVRVVNVLVTDDTLSVALEDGRTVSVPIGWYPRLAYGTPAERANFQMSSAGYGIHWPDLDEDIGVEGLMLGNRSTESSTSFKQWLRRRKQKQHPAAAG